MEQINRKHEKDINKNICKTSVITRLFFYFKNKGDVFKMANMIEKLARSAGEGFAERFKGTNIEKEIYQFECEHNHVFFIQVDLPKTILELTDLFKDIQCPICYNKNIKVKKTL